MARGQAFNDRLLDYKIGLYWLQADSMSIEYQREYVVIKMLKQSYSKSFYGRLLDCIYLKSQLKFVIYNKIIFIISLSILNYKLP